MQLLKQSTAVVISFGPFVDSGDGVTWETDLVNSLDNAVTGIMLSKNGGALAVRHATVTATTYDDMGCYRVTLDATDTGTLGRLRVIWASSQESGEPTCKAYWADFMVVPANVYDSLVLGTDNLAAALTSAERTSTADVILARALAAESYAAKSAVPTLSQILYMILSILGDFGISGTTLTTRKVDGSTTAMTFTLNDATTPTDRTRAT